MLTTFPNSVSRATVAEDKLRPGGKPERNVESQAESRCRKRTVSDVLLSVLLTLCNDVCNSPKMDAAPRGNGEERKKGSPLSPARV